MSDNLNLPSHSLEAEQSVLGAILLDNRAWDRLDGKLVAGDFYRQDHRLIFGAIESLLAQSKPADVLTVLESLRAQGDAEGSGGVVYLNALAQNTPSWANVGRYADIVRSHRMRRDIAALGHQIIELAATEAQADTLIEQASSMVMAMADARTAGAEPVEIGSLLRGVIDSLEVRMERKGGISGLSTGFMDLDEMLSGLQPADLIIVAGRPSMGKTTLAVNIAENVAEGDGVALVVSLEMAAAQLAERTVVRYGQIDTQKMRNGRLQGDDWTRLTHAVHRIENKRLIIADDPSMANVARIRLAARKVKQRRGRLDLMVIDYLQLMQGDGNNRNEDLSAITRSLKLLARELSCPILLLSQLSRKCEERPNKRPLMSDLRESGAIEQDADVVLMVYRDEYYIEGSPFKGMAEVLIRKQRMGPQGSVHLVFEGQHSTFKDAEKADVVAAMNAQPSPKKPIYSGARGFNG